MKTGPPSDWLRFVRLPPEPCHERPHQQLLGEAHPCVRRHFEGSHLSRGMKLGLVGWMMEQAPFWLRWYAEQPWPGDLLAKQLVLELFSSVIIGLTIAIVAGTTKPVSRPAVTV